MRLFATKGHRRFRALIDRTRDALRQQEVAASTLDAIGQDTDARASVQKAAALGQERDAEKTLDQAARELDQLQNEDTSIPQDGDTAKITLKRERLATTQEWLEALQAKIAADPESLGADLQRAMLGDLEREAADLAADVRKAEREQEAGGDDEWGFVFPGR
jgi:hypothetical protein